MKIGNLLVIGYPIAYMGLGGLNNCGFAECGPLFTPGEQHSGMTQGVKLRIGDEEEGWN